MTGRGEDRHRLVGPREAARDRWRWLRDVAALLTWIRQAWFAPAAAPADELQDAGRRSRGAGTRHGSTTAAPQTGRKKTQERRHGAGAGRATSAGT